MTFSSTAPVFPFPHPLLAPMDGKPAIFTVAQLRKEVYANARSVDCTGGGRANGFLGIVMPAAQYLLRAGEVFVLSVHPGTQPSHPATATQAQVTAGNRQHDCLLHVFRWYAQVTEALRQQIHTAVDPTYNNVLEDKKT